MQIFRTLPELQSFVALQRNQKKQIGFVPTMGALHTGHLSLIEKSKQENDCTIASIYVNPTQFDNLSDFSTYPISIEKDVELLNNKNCEGLFLPTTGIMYPDGLPAKGTFQISFGRLENVMEGEFRSGHFNGVAMVVGKLFNMVNPDRAYFGQKDFQQYLIIKRLSKALSYNLEVISCPIVREESGLAMSSRNRRLTHEQTALASNLFKALQLVQHSLKEGDSPEQAQAKGVQFLAKYEEINLEYLQIANAEELQSVNAHPMPNKIFIGIAAFLGEVRLIDNITFEVS